jgi:hypothetical protein
MDIQPRISTASRLHPGPTALSEIKIYARKQLPKPALSHSPQIKKLGGWKVQNRRRRAHSCPNSETMFRVSGWEMAALSCESEVEQRRGADAVELLALAGQDYGARLLPEEGGRCLRESGEVGQHANIRVGGRHGMYKGGVDAEGRRCPSRR